MKKILFAAFLLLNVAVYAQDVSNVNTLRQRLSMRLDDTTRMNVLDSLIAMTGPTEEGKQYNAQLGGLARQGMNSTDSAVARRSSIHYASFLGNMGYIAEENGDPVTALANYQEALRILKAEKRQAAVASILNNIGFVYNGLGDIPKCIAYYEASLALRDSLRDTYGIATSYNNLGTVYRDQGEFDKALLYFQRFTDTSASIKDSSGIALGLNNMGNLYLQMNDTAKARQYLNQGLALSKQIGNDKETGHALYESGNLSFKAERYREARAFYEDAIAYQNTAGHKKGKVKSMIRLAETDLMLGNDKVALETALAAHEIVTKVGYIELIETSAATLKTIYKHMGEDRLALEMYELEVKMHDSLKNESNRKIIIRNELQNEYNQKKAGLALETEKAEQKAKRDTLIRNFALGSLAIVLIFLVFVVIQRNRISKERKRSDDLLLNILPSSVARELKENGHAKTQAFEQITILFTDFKDFTRISEILSPTELVAELDHCFKEFDRIVERYQVEKIKTTGDAYMAAGGIPLLSSTHAIDTVKAAMDICAFMTELKKSRDAEGKITFEVRVGVHTGPVVAGIVGVKKFAYDIWGDSVNMASRMESSGQAGKVNISETTFELVKDKISCTYRGKVQAKNKGEIAMYFADELKS